ncbi:TPA: ATP-binding protein [Escherichia coli]|uniref:ATP-binding protein n=1 Tax=Leclercia adecarboxylata TaxID=83655 RepID=UPI0011A1C4A1|nr:ATP-binding protein [Leclercia adecarboxylata]EEV7041654.1 ATP-binding protein [Escherichia coli]EGL2905324.1 ATP-binding protein [Salmonella enterica]HDX5640301.1 ATP-binding protein [Escherichia coli]
MLKQAIDVLQNLDHHVLVTGDSGSGKTTLLAELRIVDSDCRYYRFPDLNGRQLCDDNFDGYDFLKTPERTLILDSVSIGNASEKAKVLQFIKTARKSGKRLIIVSYPTDAMQIKPLFGAVITLSGGFDNDRNCAVEFLL